MSEDTEDDDFESRPSGLARIIITVIAAYAILIVGLAAYEYDRRSVGASEHRANIPSKAELAVEEGKIDFPFEYSH